MPEASFLLKKMHCTTLKTVAELLKKIILAFLLRKCITSCFILTNFALEILCSIINMENDAQAKHLIASYLAQNITPLKKRYNKIWDYSHLLKRLLLT